MFDCYCCSPMLQVSHPHLFDHLLLGDTWLACLSLKPRGLVRTICGKISVNMTFGGGGGGWGVGLTP